MEVYQSISQWLNVLYSLGEIEIAREERKCSSEQKGIAKYTSVGGNVNVIVFLKPVFKVFKACVTLE